MAITPISTIKNWFRTGLKPTQVQFWAVFDSFFHKSEAIPAASIEGLQNLLDGKMDKKSITATIKAGTYDPTKAYVYDAAVPEYVDFSNPQSPSATFRDSGWYKLIADAAIGQTPEIAPASWKYIGSTLGDVTIEDVFGLKEALDNKVDKVTGMGLSQNSYTNEDKAKLAAMREHYKGTFISLEALTAAIPAGTAGDEAVIDAGTGTDAKKAVWDSTDNKWVIAGGGTIAMDAVPTAGSTNAVQSGGVKTELDKKQDSKVIEQMFKVNSTTDVGEFSCDVPFKINTITPQSGLMVTCKTSAGVVYTPGATVAAFDFLTFQGDTLGKTFVVKGEKV